MMPYEVNLPAPHRHRQQQVTDNQEQLMLQQGLQQTSMQHIPIQQRAISSAVSVDENPQYFYGYASTTTPATATLHSSYSSGFLNSAEMFSRYQYLRTIQEQHMQQLQQQSQQHYQQNLLPQNYQAYQSTPQQSLQQQSPSQQGLQQPEILQQHSPPHQILQEHSPPQQNRTVQKHSLQQQNLQKHSSQQNLLHSSPPQQSLLHNSPPQQGLLDNSPPHQRFLHSSPPQQSFLHNSPPHPHFIHNSSSQQNMQSNPPIADLQTNTSLIHGLQHQSSPHLKHSPPSQPLQSQLSPEQQSCISQDINRQHIQWINNDNTRMDIGNQTQNSSMPINARLNGMDGSVNGSANGSAHSSISGGSMHSSPPETSPNNYTTYMNPPYDNMCEPYVVTHMNMPSTAKNNQLLNSEIDMTSKQPSFAPTGDPERSHVYEWMKRPSYQNQPKPGKTRTKDKYRVVYTDHQRLELEKEFHISHYITIQRKATLAKELGLTERQIKIWFQNRRAKMRKAVKKGQEQVTREQQLREQQIRQLREHEANAVIVAATENVAGGIPNYPTTNGQFDA